MNDLLRLVFSYRGSLMYKMQAGMGDAVFAPLYEVLKAPRRAVRVLPRGHRLGLTAGRPGRGDRGRAAGRASGERVRRRSSTSAGLPCWPSEPIWDQLGTAAS